MPNYIWEKSATPAWLDAHDQAIAQATDGTHAIVEIPNHARLRIESFCVEHKIARSLKRAFGGTVRRLPEHWERQWLSAPLTKPLRVGRRLLVTSQAATGCNAAATLVIPASAAFGTGEHATTAMSLRLLERITRRRGKGWRMLDAGTGSGILALAGRRFGAGNVTAIDIDPLAIKTAKWNARQNAIRGIDFRVADVTRAVSGRFDIITANLFSELLERLLPRFRKCLASDGRMILSGVMRGQESGLRRALAANRFAIREARRRGKWIALLCATEPKT